MTEVDPRFKVQFNTLLLAFFILPLLTYERLLIRSMILSATVLWVLSSVLLISFIFFTYKNGFKWHGGLILIAIFTVYEVVRDLTSTSIVRSLFGDARGSFLSVLTTVSLFIVYITTVQFSYDENKKSKILLTMVVSVSIVSVISILQHFMQIPFLNPSMKAYATLQTTSEVAGICLLMTGVVGRLFFIRNNKYEKQPVSLSFMEKFIYYVSIPLFSFAIIATGNKAAIFFQAAFITYFTFKFAILKDVKLVMFFLIILFGNLLIYYLPVNSEYAQKSKHGSIEVSIDKFEISLSSRLKIWELATKMWIRRPFVGWGQADYPNAFSKFKTQNNKNTTEIVADTHNWFIDALSKGGLVKLTLLLLTMLFFIKNGAFKSSLNNFLLISIGMYFMYLLLNPSYLVNKVYLFTLVGLISMNSNRHSVTKPQKILFIIGILFSIAYFIFNIYFGYLRINAEIVGTRGVRSTFNGGYTQGIYYSKKAAQIFPYEPDYWQRLGWAYKMRYYKTKSKQDIIDAIDSYKQGLKLAPDDISMKDRITNLNKQLSTLNK